MTKEYTIVGFVTAFKKPSRTKAGVSSGDKKKLEKAVKKKNLDSFAEDAKNLYDSNPDYFVELLGYKLGKHWDSVERDIWLNKSPEAAVKKVFDKLTTKNPPDFDTWRTGLTLENGMARAEQRYQVKLNKAKTGTDRIHASVGESDEVLQESLQGSGVTAFRECLDTIGSDKLGEPWIANTMIKTLDMGKLLAFGEVLFGEAGESWNLDEELATDDLSALARSLDKLNEIYEKTINKYDTEGETPDIDKWSLVKSWSHAMKAKVYERRDQLLKTAEDSEELFGFSGQLDALRNARAFDVEEETLKVIKDRLALVSDKPYLFDVNGVNPQPNDCQKFSILAFGKMSGQEAVTPKKPVIPAELKDEERQAAVEEMEAQFELDYAKSQGVVRIGIMYTDGAMCPYHYRTVVGKVGDKYLTVEANIGKMFMLAPEVLCLSVEELLCGTDGEANKRKGFEFEFLGAVS